MAQTKSTRAPRDQAINIRATRQQRDLIDHASQAVGKSRSDFMLDAATHAAEDVLLDRSFFALDNDAFEQFCALLDSPPPPSDNLRALLRGETPWS